MAKPMNFAEPGSARRQQPPPP